MNPEDLAILGATAAFVVGSLVGLEYSYRVYGEIFRERRIDPIALPLALLGWSTLAVSWVKWRPLGLPAGAFLAGFVVNMRPGYGRIETALGLLLFCSILLAHRGMEVIGC